MKHLPWAVAAAVLLFTALTIAVGARVREDTVVRHPYEEGLAAQHPVSRAADHARAQPRAQAAPCDLAAGPCTAAAGGAVLSLELGPRPLAAMRELTVEAALREAGAGIDEAELEVSFAMPGMEMGPNAVRLAPLGGGRYRGVAVLVRCPSGRREWRASVTVRRGGRGAQATFAITLGG